MYRAVGQREREPEAAVRHFDPMVLHAELSIKHGRFFCLILAIVLLMFTVYIPPLYDSYGDLPGCVLRNPITIGIKDIVERCNVLSYDIIERDIPRKTKPEIFCRREHWPQNWYNMNFTSHSFEMMMGSVETKHEIDQEFYDHLKNDKFKILFFGGSRASFDSPQVGAFDHIQARDLHNTYTKYQILELFVSADSGNPTTCLIGGEEKLISPHYLFDFSAIVQCDYLKYVPKQCINHKNYLYFIIGIGILATIIISELLLRNIDYMFPFLATVFAIANQQDQERLGNAMQRPGIEMRGAGEV
jgi:hypothetical protein